MHGKVLVELQLQVMNVSLNAGRWLCLPTERFPFMPWHQCHWPCPSSLKVEHPA
jgi:hypothetical protein